ncbi:hypothetical protein [Brumimicrobium mesophilum]|uniref:hypothetical protein n=1 Tax=Brumimicrobium mesophilum TaxID=392717 RepID=UPI000D13FCAF|nr:hypothetical protein [Brumimicrobium mesophilum]
MSIQLYSIQLKKLYLFIALLSPMWMLIPVLIQMYGGHQYAVIFLGLILLTITLILAQIFARKSVILKVEKETIIYDDISISKSEIQSIKINKSGIGISAIEFNVQNDQKIILHLPNLKGNAEKGIAFIENNLPDVKIIEPVDLLED